MEIGVENFVTLNVMNSLIIFSNRCAIILIISLLTTPIAHVSCNSFYSVCVKISAT